MISRKTYTTFEKSGIRWTWLGRVSYPDSECLQKEIEKQRRKREVSDTLLLLEHPHTFTIGWKASKRDILIDSSRLKKESVEVFRCDRGGQVTYHGPGQLVGYIIMDLYERHLSVPRFVWQVEEGIRCWMAPFGICAERVRGHPGLWYRGQKIASIGFHISRGISRHGFSINIAPDLSYFNYIIPCGVQTPVTSLSREMDFDFKMERIGGQMARWFDQIFSGSESKESDSSTSSNGSSCSSSSISLSSS